jgi:hypothetical protein
MALELSADRTMAGHEAGRSMQCATHIFVRRHCRAKCVRKGRRAEGTESTGQERATRSVKTAGSRPGAEHPPNASTASGDGSPQGRQSRQSTAPICVAQVEPASREGQFRLEQTGRARVRSRRELAGPERQGRETDAR